MSYSTRRVGMPVLVRDMVAKDLSTATCPEPEQTAKGKVAEAVDALLALYPPSQPVEVSISGSQSGPFSKEDEHVTGELTVTIKPIRDFVL